MPTDPTNFGLIRVRVRFNQFNKGVKEVIKPTLFKKAPLSQKPKKKKMMMVSNS